MFSILARAKSVAVFLACASIPAGAVFAAEPHGGFIGGSPTAPNSGQALFTSHGSVIATGHVGSEQTTTLPNGGGQGFLTNNGNGTSTLVGPTGTVTTLPSPR